MRTQSGPPEPLGRSDLMPCSALSRCSSSSGLLLNAGQVARLGRTCAGEVTYERKDGSELTVPWATVSRFDDGRLAEYLAYVDPSQLFAPGARGGDGRLRLSGGPARKPDWAPGQTEERQR